MRYRDLDQMHSLVYEARTALLRANALYEETAPGDAVHLMADDFSLFLGPRGDRSTTIQEHATQTVLLLIKFEQTRSTFLVNVATLHSQVYSARANERTRVQLEVVKRLSELSEAPSRDRLNHQRIIEETRRTMEGERWSTRHE